MLYEVITYLADWYDKNSSAVIDLINQIKWVSNDLSIDYKDKNQVLEEIREHVITSYSIHYTKLYDRRIFYVLRKFWYIHNLF